MSENYDIIIVGASIAGLYTGMKLAKAGQHVCIVDRKKEIGVPVRCGEATGNRAELARFIDIDESWIAQDIKGLAVHHQGSTPAVLEMKDLGVILHRDRFEKALAQKAADHGAELLLETNVSGLIGGQDTYTGVKCDNGKEISGAIIIGADGCESKVGRWAGITDAIPLKDAFSSIQYQVKSDFCSDGYLHFFIGSSVIPGGYIWVFPKSDNEISVGAGLYKGNNSSPKVKELLDAFIKKNIPSVTCNNLITGCVPLSICPKQLGKDNVIVIGDAARQANPITAGGIMNTLEAADLAVNAILRSNKKSVYRSIAIHYSHKWKKTQRRQQKIFYLFKEIFLDCTDKNIEVIIKKVPKISKNIDRSTPFTFPILTFIRVCLIVLPKFVKNFRILFR